MDTYYLNNAVHLLEDYLQTTNRPGLGRLDHLRPAPAALLGRARTRSPSACARWRSTPRRGRRATRTAPGGEGRQRAEPSGNGQPRLKGARYAGRLVQQVIPYQWLNAFAPWHASRPCIPSVDIIREDLAEKKKKRRIVIAIASAAGILLITLGLSRLKPAAPTVDKSAIWTDTVKRGAMLRQVRGPGTLVPEEVRYISAATDGRIERLVRLPGARRPARHDPPRDVEPRARARRARRRVAAARRRGRTPERRAPRADKEVMDQQATAATVRSDFHQAELQAETNEGLFKEGLIAELTVKLSRVKAEELATRNAIEEKRVASVQQAADAQMAVQEAHVQALRALANLKRGQKGALHVRAGISGVLQEVPVQVGQQVAPGTVLAKVAEPTKLKAELKIAETQAKDVVIGQPASIDTRNGVVDGQGLPHRSGACRTAR